MGETVTSGEEGDKEFVPQSSGTFYDLLPEGAAFVKKSVQVMDAYDNRELPAFTVNTIDNYQGSGRTMVIVHVNETGKAYVISFDTNHAWNAIKDYGNMVYNPVAYETGNSSIYNGFPDNGGKIKSDVGQTIVSAAIIDDVIGIIVLTIVLGVSSGKGGYLGIILKTLAFFVCAIIAGFIVYRLFRWYDKRHPRSRRIPIYALGVALIFAFCAEHFFGIADITGAYIAGIVFCSLSDASYMESKIDINAYMIFSPIFFASIGLKTDLSGMNLNLLWFSIAFVIVGCLSKIIGCGGISKLLGFNWKECLQIGEGMMVRGEVALIVATKGLSAGLVDSKYFTSVILLIIVSSMIVPILLKKAFSDSSEEITATTPAE